MIFKVFLNDNELEIIKLIGNKRILGEPGGFRTNYPTCDDPYIHIRGFAGEFAFCKMFNCFPSFCTKNKSSESGTDKGDVRIRKHLIDVKTTKYSNGKLLINKEKKINGDFYALMTGEGNMFSFRGFIKQEKVIRPERLIDFNGRISYVVEQSELVLPTSYENI